MDTSLFNRNSIIFKITLVFLIAITSIGTLFFMLYESQKGEALDQAIQRHKNLIKTMQIQLRHEGMVDGNALKDMAFQVVNTDPNTIIAKAEVIVEHKSRIGIYLTVIDNGEIYIISNSLKNNFILKDVGVNTKPKPILKVVFVGIFGLLCLFYLMILRSFLPLKRLKLEIKRFSQGELDISTKSERKDEIATVANEFDRAIVQIRELTASRQAFLRSIMHELKTPITKGRITAEMLNDEKQKERLIKVFDRLTSLVNELAELSKVGYKGYEFAPKEHTIDEVIEHVNFNLMEDGSKSDEVEIQKVGEKIDCDIGLMSLGIKNLIENGLKFKRGEKVVLYISKDEIFVSNKGAPLDEPFEFYTKAFNKKDSDGFGLGLYIVDMVAKLHGMKFGYEHLDERNVFRLKRE